MATCALGLMAAFPSSPIVAIDKEASKIEVSQIKMRKVSWDEYEEKVDMASITA